ncbi:MAG: hypothetical protein ACI82A_003602 [Candidatus Azotimanducaceae bacterium]|jgi:hypothetical protein
MDSLDQLRVTTPSGSVPVSNFVERRAKNKLDSIERVDGEYIMTTRANVKSGTVADNKVVEQEEFIQSSSFVSIDIINRDIVYGGQVIETPWERRRVDRWSANVAEINVMGAACKFDSSSNY